MDQSKPYRDLVATLGLLAFAGTVPAQTFDYLIRNGSIVDGTGRPAFDADIGINGDTIAAIGDLDGASARNVIDASGRVVVPGFIDVHGHADDGEGHFRGFRTDDDVVRAAIPSVIQGITTTVTNSDGHAPAMPLAEQLAEVKWPIGINAVYMASHGRIRRAVMGADHMRPATADEIVRMKALVAADLEAGAFGLAAVLEGGAERWAPLEELIDVTSVLRDFDGVYIAHPRSQSLRPAWWLPSVDGNSDVYAPSMFDASEELIRIAEANAIRVSISHISMRGPDPNDDLGRTVAAVEAARARGVQIFGDQNPYRANPISVFSPLIPTWATNPNSGRLDPRRKFDHKRELLEVVKSPERLAALRMDVAHRISFWGGAERIFVTDALDQDIIGRSLAEIASANGREPVDQVIQLAVDGDPYLPGGFLSAGFFRPDEEVATWVKTGWVAGDTDAAIRTPYMRGFTHPRMYGTFPLWIRRYVLDQKLVSLEFAIRSLTKVAAEIVGLRDRGEIREGFAADLVILDLEHLHPRSSFYDVHRFPDGVDFVLVNGVLAVDRGEPTWALPGRVLKKAVK